MRDTYETVGHIDANGRLEVHDREDFKRAMTQFGRGLVVTVRVEAFVERRTRQANAYYWIVIGHISDHTGYEKDELHELFKQKFNPVTVKVGRDERVVGGSTRRMKTDKFYEYVERIRRFAETELGVTTPDPERSEAA